MEISNYIFLLNILIFLLVSDNEKKYQYVSFIFDFSVRVDYDDLIYGYIVVLEVQEK